MNTLLYWMGKKETVLTSPINQKYEEAPLIELHSVIIPIDNYQPHPLTPPSLQSPILHQSEHNIENFLQSYIQSVKSCLLPWCCRKIK